jgi:cell division protein FtsQ
MILKSRKFRVLATVFTIVSLVAATLLQLERNNFFALKEIAFENILDQEIIGPQLPSTDDRYIEPLKTELKMDLKKFENQSLWKVSLDEVISIAKEKSWIKKVEIRRSWPDSVKIKILPKKVAYLYVSPEGSVQPLLEDNTLMGQARADQLPSAIILRQRNDEVRKQALQIWKTLPERGSFSRENISEIGFHSKEGYWAKIVDKDFKVKLGFDRMEIKSLRAQEVMDYLEKRNLIVSEIDTDLRKKVLVRLAR